MSPEDIARTQQLVALVGAGILLFDVLLLLVWGYRRGILQKPTFAPVWSLVNVWNGVQLALLLTFVVACLLIAGFFLVRLAYPAMRFPDDDTSLLFYFALPATIVQNIFFFAVPAGFIWFKYGKRLRDIGLPPLPKARDWWAGILIGLTLMIVSTLLGSGLETVAQHFRHIAWVRQALEMDQNNPVAAITKTLPRQSSGILLVAVFTIGISAPLGEEMLFRGFLFNALKHRFGLTTGLIVSALLFAAVHQYAIGLVPVFFMGLALAWIYQTSGSLWTGIIVHATNNTLLVLLAYLFPSLAK